MAGVNTVPAKYNTFIIIKHFIEKAWSFDDTSCKRLNFVHFYLQVKIGYFFRALYAKDFLNIYLNGYKVM